MLHDEWVEVSVIVAAILRLKMSLAHGCAVHRRCDTKPNWSVRMASHGHGGLEKIAPRSGDSERLIWIRIPNRIFLMLICLKGIDRKIVMGSVSLKARSILKHILTFAGSVRNGSEICQTR